MDQFALALGNLFTPWPFFYCFLGVSLGIMVGAIPGLTGTMLITLTIPMTFFMDSVHAMVLLVAMYVGAGSGSQISAILLRMPGTPSSIMTTFDGFPMAQAGRPGRALGLGITSSFIGGMVSFVVLLLLSPPLARFATQFGPWEYFTLVLMALVLIASLSQGSFLKGILSGLLGMLAAMPGFDPSMGKLRLTLGVDELAAGFSLLPVLIGTFAMSQIFKDIVNINQKLEPMPVSRQGLFLSLADFRRHGANFLRSSLIGTWIGILPGIGSNIGSMIAYMAAKNVSKTPEKFGTGHEPGVVASETANNAVIGGALIPLITMGIPGSPVDAILIGALIIHNLQPGPLLFVNNPEVAFGIIAAYLVANVLMFLILVASVARIAKLIYVERSYLLPAILVFSCLGAFALHNRFFDVWVMLGFGALGFFLERCKVPLGPFVIGFVLAGLAEAKLRSGLMASGGSWTPLFTRPLSLTFLLLSVAFLLYPLYREWRGRRGTGPAGTGGATTPE